MKKFLVVLFLAIVPLNLQDHFVRLAHADLAPSPDHPCYHKNEGDSCTIESTGEKGVCEKVCRERVIDEKRKYKSCSTYCTVKKPEEPKVEQPKTMSLNPKAGEVLEPIDKPSHDTLPSCSLIYSFQ